MPGNLSEDEYEYAGDIPRICGRTGFSYPYLYTVDPETDSVARIWMKKYADSLGADPAKWVVPDGKKG